MDPLAFITSKTEVEARTLKKPSVVIYSLGGFDFAIVHEQKAPLKISLRCDPVLSKSLQKQYESVMAGHELDPKEWVTVLYTEQIPDDLMRDLINYAYHRAETERA